MTDWTTRLATNEDIGALCDLLKECVDDMHANGIDQWDGIYPTRSILLDDVESGSAYVATSRASELVGSVVLNEYQDPQYSEVAWTINGQPTVVVHRLMVRPANQRQGVARFLMRFAEQQAAALGYRAVRLDAFSKNPRALRLYRDLGYRDAGTVQLRKGPFHCFEKALVVV